MLRVLEQDREWRRAHPAEFLAEIADDLWLSMPDDEALDDFRLRLANVPWWAAAVVESLEHVLAHRPDWAAPSLVRASGRGPWLGGSPETEPEPYLDWLARQVGPMRFALDQARGRSR